jgi:hypothetical protein
MIINMKKLTFIIFTFFLFLPLFNATSGVMATKQDMIEIPDVIVVVQIQNIVSINNDKPAIMSDLIAIGYLTKYLKGKKFFSPPHGINKALPPNSIPDIEKLEKINFRVRRDSILGGCFDISTGPNLVFLKKDKNEYVGFYYGVNMPHSPYIYLNAKSIKWYDIEGKPQKIIDEIEKLINKTIPNPSSRP